MSDDIVTRLRADADGFIQPRHQYTVNLEREAADEIERLRAGIREWASECAECDGTGIAQYFEQIDPEDIVKGCRKIAADCQECADIRALLGPVAACQHEWGEIKINNAASPLDPPRLVSMGRKCIHCGAPEKP